MVLHNNSKIPNQHFWVFFHTGPIRLVRLALGSERIKTQLRANQTGIFILTSEKWQQIMDRIEKEELESILAQGLEDIDKF